MECRRHEINPHTGLPCGRCDCDWCLGDARRHRILEGCELVLRAAMVQLLDSGLMPEEMVHLVRGRSPKSSRAWMLTRVELTCQAGYWLSRPDWSVQLDQVDRLSKHTGFHVGTTIPGWMQRWCADKASHDEQIAVRSVRHVRTALSEQLVVSAPTSPVGPAHLDLSAPSSSPTCVVLPFRHRPR